MVSILTIIGLSLYGLIKKLWPFGPKTASSAEVVEQVKSCYDGNPIRDYRMVEVEETDFLDLDEEPH
jgi:hypothetical protein